MTTNLRRDERRLYSAEDLLRLQPEEEDHHYELDDGELILVTPTGALHGSVESRIVRRLAAFVEEGRLGEVVCGEVGFQLGENTVRAPDVAFLGRERLASIPFPAEGYYPGVPDLAIEILSPSDSAGEVLRKAGRFVEAGTRLVWIIDPRRKIVTVYRKSGPISLVHEEGHLDGEDVLPGFACPVTQLFPEG